VEFEYAPEALAILAVHGLQPTPSTPPRVVRGALNDLYRYEIRRLKRRFLAGEFHRERYLEQVVELRQHYWLLSVPVDRWVRTK
jgi:hypothetical protein